MDVTMHCEPAENMGLLKLVDMLNEWWEKFQTADGAVYADLALRSFQATAW